MINCLNVVSCTLHTAVTCCVAAQTEVELDALSDPEAQKLTGEIDPPKLTEGGDGGDGGGYGGVGTGSTARVEMRAPGGRGLPAAVGEAPRKKRVDTTKISNMQFI